MDERWQEAITNPGDVVIVGAGVIGLCSAIELARAGQRVVVLDRGPIDGGCARGSAGHLVPSHVLPLAGPGALRTALHALSAGDGAVSVQRSASPALAAWMASFARHATRRNLETAAPALARLHRLSDELWTQWYPDIDDGEGLLDVYGSLDALKAAAAQAQVAARFGVEHRLLGHDEVRALEPSLTEAVVGAVLYPEDRRVDPEQAMDALVATASEAGVVLVPDTEVTLLRAIGRQVTDLVTARGTIRAERLVLATGAWSPTLAAQLDVHLPVQPARGMSVTFRLPQDTPTTSMLLGERHVAVAPMADRLRLSAWFQLGVFDQEPDGTRIERMIALARQVLHLPSELDDVQRWAGLRPATPDGVPIIGTAPAYDNVTLATGHSMLGLTLGPGTGRLVAQVALGKPPEIDLDRFSPSRFRAPWRRRR